MTAYNVMEDRDEWARIKVNLMCPGDREALLRRLIIEDQQCAATILGDLVASDHGWRMQQKQRVNGFRKGRA